MGTKNIAVRIESQKVPKCLDYGAGKTILGGCPCSCGIPQGKPYGLKKSEQGRIKLKFSIPIMEVLNDEKYSF